MYEFLLVINCHLQGVPKSWHQRAAKGVRFFRPSCKLYLAPFTRLS